MTARPFILPRAPGQPHGPSLPFGRTPQCFRWPPPGLNPKPEPIRYNGPFLDLVRPNSPPTTPRKPPKQPESPPPRQRPQRRVAAALDVLAGLPRPALELIAEAAVELLDAMDAPTADMEPDPIEDTGDAEAGTAPEWRPVVPAKRGWRAAL